MQTQGVAATGHSYIVYNREIQSWLTGSFCDFHQVSRYVSYRDSSIAIRIVSWGYRIVTPLDINHSIIIKSCQTYPEHIVMCHNAKTGLTATLSTIIFEPKTAAIHERQTRFTLRHHQNTSWNKNQIFVFLPETLDVRLFSSSFAFKFCMLQLAYLQKNSKAYA